MSAVSTVSLPNPPGPPPRTADVGPAAASGPLLEWATVVSEYAVGPASRATAATPADTISSIRSRKWNVSHRPTAPSTAPTTITGCNHGANEGVRSSRATARPAEANSVAGRIQLPHGNR